MDVTINNQENFKIKKEFDELHKDLVNKIVEFCSKYNLPISDAHLTIDSLHDSIEFGSWHPSTDSSFVLYRGRIKMYESV